MPLFLYRPPLRAVVRHLKFGGLSYLGRHVAQLVAERERPAVAGCDLIVPVPLHWWRRICRGYNQAEEIARPLARELGRPWARSLVRTRATTPQTNLSGAARKSNVVGAFDVRRRADLSGRHIALIDDVTTTGGTLDAASRELKRAGAARVTAVVLARAIRAEPEPAQPLARILKQ